MRSRHYEIYFISYKIQGVRRRAVKRNCNCERAAAGTLGGLSEAIAPRPLVGRRDGQHVSARELADEGQLRGRREQKAEAGIKEEDQEDSGASFREMEGDRDFGRGGDMGGGHQSLGS